jgi:hypothetical protein
MTRPRHINIRELLRGLQRIAANDGRRPRPSPRQAIAVVIPQRFATPKQNYREGGRDPLQEPFDANSTPKNKRKAKVQCAFLIEPKT